MGYTQIRCCVKVIVRVFFRQIDVVGAMRIPTSGATIFVANHANQFVDPMMLISSVPRVMRFLIAAKSLKRRLIGDAARALNSIGVVRPQDLATKGSGTVTVNAATGDKVVIGKGTDFQQSVSAGCKIKVNDVELTVSSVESNTRCILSAACPVSLNGEAYKILPKVDQNAMYVEVHEALRSGDCIGIFPEGGSHDQASMLDLKPGVAIMALGAMNNGSGPVQICPCGLNYFEPYRFRSRVVVEFGEPITVSAELAEQYKTDKRGAVKSLMKLIEHGMGRVMPGAADFKEMQAIVTMRALWKPPNRKLTPEEDIRITQRLASSVKQLKDDPRVADIVAEIQDYNDKLLAAGIRDRDVRKNLPNAGARRLLMVKAISLMEVIVLLPFACTFYMLFLPVAVITYVSAMREKKTALAGSTVKVKALDVVASQKIKVGLVTVPIYGIFLALLVMWISGIAWWYFPVIIIVVWPALIFLGTRVCDEFWKQLLHCRTNLLRKKSRALLDERTDLQERLVPLIEELGPQVIEDWDNTRIITPDEHTLLTPLLG